MAGTPSDSGAFVGRTADLARVAALLNGPAPCNLVLLGAAGCGKSRLAAEIVGLGIDRGLAALVIRATRSAAAIPLGALASFLPTATDEPTDQRVDVAARATDTITGSADIVLVDDAHLLDPWSAEVVSQLAEARLLIVVATFRSGEPVPESLTGLAAGNNAERFDVGELTELETGALAASLLGGPLGGAGVVSLFGTSRGNPLFVRELLLDALDSGHMTSEGGVWRLTGPLRASARLAQLVGSRIKGLPLRAADALDLIAIAEPIGRERLISLTSASAVETLVQRELVVVGSDGQRCPVRLAHPLYGELAGADMGALRRVAVHRRLAEALEADGARRREDTLALGMLRLEAGGEAQPGILLAAARQAHQIWDTDLAIRLAEAAAQAGAGAPAWVLAAEAMIQIGRDAEGEAFLERAMDEATSDRQRSLAAIQLVTARFWGRAPHGATALAGRAEALSQITDPAWHDELIASTAIFEALDGEPRTALARVEPILHRTEGRTYVAATLAACTSMLWSGRLRDAEHVALLGMGAWSSLEDTEGMLDISFFTLVWVLAVMEQGRFDEVRPAVEQNYARAAATHNVSAQGWTAAVSARLSLLTGSVHDCSRFSAEAAALFRDTNNPRFRRLHVAMHGHAEALRGDREAARAVLESLDGDDSRPVGVLEAEVTRALSRLDWGDGRGREARERLAAAAEDAADRGSHMMALALWHDLAMLGDARGAAAAMQGRAVAVDGELAAARFAHVEALAATGATGLEVVSERFEGLGALLFAADAAAAAGSRHRKSGERRRAEQFDDQARRLSVACGVGSTPSSRPQSSALLTSREHEVARLAAEGLSSAEVAQRLGLSVRTVDNHLQRGFEKLGISSRQELGGLLFDLGAAN